MQKPIDKGFKYYSKKTLNMPVNSHVSAIFLSLFVASILITIIITYTRVNSQLATTKESSQAATCYQNLITVNQPQHYTFNQGCLQEGAVIYKTDSRFTFSSIPDYLRGAGYIQPQNIPTKNDKDLEWSVTAKQNLNVYVLWRKIKNTTPPSFIVDNYTRISPTTYATQNDLSNYVVRKNTSNIQGLYDIYKYKRSFTTGQTLSLKAATEDSNRAYSMYMVAFIPINSPTATPLTQTPIPQTPAPTAVPTKIPTPNPTIPGATPVPTAIKTATPAPATPAPATPVPTAAPPSAATTVASHNTKTNCWTVYNGSVYNLTSYFGMHPGGDSKLQNACGKDMTSIWRAIGVHQSSNSSGAGFTALNPLKICVYSNCSPY